jgi:cell division protein FtsB
VNLERQNEVLAKDIKLLEQEVTRMGSDPKTIAKAAARELGMARSDETVYLFQRRGRTKTGAADAE